MASLSFYQLRISNKDENKDIENASTLQATLRLNSEHLAYVNINNSAYIGKRIYFAQLRTVLHDTRIWGT